MFPLTEGMTADSPQAAHQAARRGSELTTAASVLVLFTFTWFEQHGLNSQQTTNTHLYSDSSHHTKRGVFLKL